ncbi:MAG: TatD family hydrolase, partial [Deltaproteobacteria bacterium]|nr:TatD family hydrolase [Deltaproteobacteria bacterium]
MLIDSHSHLDMEDFDDDRSDVIDRAISGGLTNIITIGIDFGSSLTGMELAKKYNFVHATAGYHPHNASTCNPQGLERLAQIASEQKVVAWGEIGLDFYRRYSPRDDQLRAFQQQLGIAHDLNLPIIIHDR